MSGATSWGSFRVAVKMKKSGSVNLFAYLSKQIYLANITHWLVTLI
jgi:hypothetical protein